MSLYPSVFEYDGLYLETYNRDTDTWNTNQLVLTGAGNVGIGTTGPGTKLHVAGGHITVDDTTPYLYLKDTDGGTLNSISESGSAMYIGGDTAASTMIFRNKASWGESMRINGAGNVGIGTTGPVTMLDVGGDIAVNGAMIINDLGQWVGDPTGLQGPPGPTLGIYDSLGLYSS